MSEEAQPSAPSEPVAPAPPVAVEESQPESFNIFSDEPSPIESSPAPQAPQESDQGMRKGQAFLSKMREDKARRESEIALKQKEASLAKRMSEIEEKARHLESIGTNPTEFLKSQGINPLDFQRKLAEHALNGGPSKEEQIERTQLELAKLKSSIERKEKQAEEAQKHQRNRAAIQQFVSNIGSYGESNNEKYPLVAEQMSPGDIAEGMAAFYRQTGNQLSIEEAYERLEAGLKEHETAFYSNERNLEKFRRYNNGALQKNVRGPQATLSSSWSEQPTRKDPQEMSYEEIRDHWKGKLFT
jgi:hypothetical protein